MAETNRPARQDFIHFMRIPTRWIDNDIYGHVNNVIFYAWFDTVINTYLIEQGGLDIYQGRVIGVAVESKCSYFQSVAFPDQIDAGLRVARLGNSSVRYEVGLFRHPDQDPAAFGYFVHVFVDRLTRRPVPIPEPIRGALERLLVSPAE